MHLRNMLKEILNNIVYLIVTEMILVAHIHDYNLLTVAVRNCGLFFWGQMLRSTRANRTW